MSTISNGISGGQGNRQTGADGLDLGRQTPQSASTDSQALKVIDSRHKKLQTIPSNTLNTITTHKAATSDVFGLKSFTDEAL